MSYVPPNCPKCPLPVLGHSAVAVGDIVLVWGGYTTAQHLIHEGFMEPYVDSKILWMYNPENDHWHPVVTEGDVPMGTSGAGLVIIGHYLYLFGGYTNIGNTSDLYRLDLATMIWEMLHLELHLQPSPRDKFMCWAHDERLYVFGGFGVATSDYLCHHGAYVLDNTLQSSRGWNNQLFIFDVKLKEWSNPKCTGNIPSPRAAAATTCIKHNMYLFGGRHCDRRLNDLYCLNLNTLEWRRLYTPGVCPGGRSWHTFTAISPHHIVLYGGYTQEQVTLNEVWLLNVDTLEWTSYTSQTELKHRLWHTATFTENKDLVIFGGCSNDILSMEVPAKSHNEAFVFRFTPHSLLRLCLDASHRHRSILEQEFESLPKILHQRLLMRQNKRDDEATDEDEAGNTRTCSVS